MATPFGVKTIAGRIIMGMRAEGYILRGHTSGWLSFRPNSNLGQLLKRLNLTPDQVVVKCGAKRQHRTQGTQLLVFTR